VGRFNTVKNHDFLIDIFAECVRKKENIRLLLVGDGEEKQKIEEKVKQMGLEKKVIFTGVRSDVERLMQIMNVFVFPSFYEGLPVTMVEAQAAGLPCVISDHVSEECIITENLVTEVSLDEKPEKWADIILKSAEIEKKNRSEEIRKAGYDICKEAKKMQKFYIHCAERE
jgi:glycosyltransferase involved in cell wall biosynthesis